MKNKKIKIPFLEKRLVVVYTKNLEAQNELDKLRRMLYDVDWETEKWILLPSEYIKKIKYVKK